MSWQLIFRGHFSNSPSAIFRPRFTPDRVRFVQGDFRRLPSDDDRFDLVWCAQSLYSLPDPLEALQKMRQKTKPGGFVAVIENDEFHHVLLPWPIEIELALCQAAARCHTSSALASRESSTWVASSASCSMRPA